MGHERHLVAVGCQKIQSAMTVGGELAGALEVEAIRKSIAVDSHKATAVGLAGWHKDRDKPALLRTRADS